MKFIVGIVLCTVVTLELVDCGWQDVFNKSNNKGKGVCNSLKTILKCLQKKEPNKVSACWSHMKKGSLYGKVCPKDEFNMEAIMKPDTWEKVMPSCKEIFECLSKSPLGGMMGMLG